MGSQFVYMEFSTTINRWIYFHPPTVFVVRFAGSVIAISSVPVNCLLCSSPLVCESSLQTRRGKPLPSWGTAQSCCLLFSCTRIVWENITQHSFKSCFLSSPSEKAALKLFHPPWVHPTEPGCTVGSAWLERENAPSSCPLGVLHSPVLAPSPCLAAPWILSRVGLPRDQL